MQFIRSISNDSIAEQLAKLLNSHNQLRNRKTAQELELGRVNYIVELHGSLLIGACGLEKQSYSLTEIKHLVVKPQWRGKGLGKFLVRRAISISKTPLLYATVRGDNMASRKLFESLGFTVAGSYKGNHEVTLLVKVNSQWKKNEKYSFAYR